MGTMDVVALKHPLQLPSVMSQFLDLPQHRLFHSTFLGRKIFGGGHKKTRENRDKDNSICTQHFRIFCPICELWEVNGANMLVTPILQMKKPSHGKVEGLPHSHTAGVGGGGTGTQGKVSSPRWFPNDAPRPSSRVKQRSQK